MKRHRASTRVARGVHPLRGGFARGVAATLVLAMVAPALGGQPVFRGSGVSVDATQGSSTPVKGGGGATPAAKPLAVTGSPALLTAYQTGSPTFGATYLFTGGQAPYSAVVSGLPSGVTEQTLSDRVTLSGAPDAAGTYEPVTITVTDAAGTVASVISTAIVVTDAPPVQALPLVVVAEPDLATAGYVGTTFSAHYVATTADGSADAIASASFSPPLPGFAQTINGDGSLDYVGTPTAAGTLPATTVTLVDANGLSGTYTSPPVTVTAGFGVLAAQVTPPTASTVAPGTGLDYQVDYGGGTPPYVVTWDVLPQGLFVGAPVDDGFSASDPGDLGHTGHVEVKGTPGQPSNPSTTFTVTDATGKVARAVAQGFALGDANAALAIVPNQFANGTYSNLGPRYELQGTPPAAASQQYLLVYGGTPPYAATLSPANDGIATLDASELGYGPLTLTAIATTPGPVPAYVVTVTDSAGASASYATSPGVAYLRPADPISIVAQQDVASYVPYQSYQGYGGSSAPVFGYYVVSGGTPLQGGGTTYSGADFFANASYAVTVDGRPPGVTLDVIGSTITIGGRPTAYGPYGPMVIHATDANGATTSYATTPFVVQVPPLLFNGDGQLQSEFTAGTQVSTTIRASGGVPPYAIAQGPLDAGLATSVDAASDAVTVFGVPPQGSGAAMTFTVTDSVGQVASYATPAFVVDPSGPYADGGQTFPVSAADPEELGSTPFSFSQLAGPTSLSLGPDGTVSATYVTQVSGDVSIGPQWSAYGYPYSTATGGGTITADGPLSTTFTFPASGAYQITVGAYGGSFYGPGGFQDADTGSLVVNVSGFDNGPLVAVANPPAVLDYPPEQTPSPQCFADGAFFSGGQGPFSYSLTSSDGSVAIDQTQYVQGFCVGTTGGTVSGDGGSGGAVVTIRATDAQGRVATSTLATQAGYPPLVAPSLFALVLEGIGNSGDHGEAGITGGAQPLSNVVLTVAGDTYGVRYSVTPNGSSASVDASGVDQAALRAASSSGALANQSGNCTYTGLDAKGVRFSLTSSCVVALANP